MTVRDLRRSDFDAVSQKFSLGNGAWESKASFEAVWDHAWNQESIVGVVASEGSDLIGVLSFYIVPHQVTRRHTLPPQLSVHSWIHGQVGHELSPFAASGDRQTELFARQNSAGLGIVLQAFGVVPGDANRSQTTTARLVHSFLWLYGGMNVVSLVADQSQISDPVLLKALSLNPEAKSDISSSYHVVPAQAGSDSLFASYLCSFGRPQLPLSSRLRRLLYHASHRRDDTWIAQKMGLSRSSMKTYWDRIYASIESVSPGALYATGDTRKSAAIAFVEANQSERWPIGDPVGDE